MAGLRELTPAFVAGLVGCVYEAALDPQRWPDVLDMIEGVYRDSRVTLFAHRGGRPCEGLAFHRNFGADDFRAYIDYFVGNSPYVAGVDRLVVGRPAYSETIVTDDALFRTEHYNDFVRPRRLGHYAVGVLLERDARGMTALSVCDQRNDENRRAHQKRLLDVIAPNFLRAIRLHDVATRQAAAANAARAAFDRWTCAAAVLDASGQLITMNAVATKLLTREAGLWVDREGFLQSPDLDGLRDLRLNIACCANISGKLDLANMQRPMSIALRRPEPAPALQAMTWPLPCDGRQQSGVPKGRVLLVIFDPSQTLRTPTGWLADRYGLAPSEAKLTEAIVSGVPLADAAKQLGIKLSTARTRLKIIQSKTGCSRQVDLVRLALSVPSLGQN